MRSERMLTATIMALALLSALVACGGPEPTSTATPAATATPTPETLSEVLERAANVTLAKFDWVTTTAQGTTQTTKFWVKGNRWRIELPQLGPPPLATPPPHPEGTTETRVIRGYLIDTDANIVYALYSLYSPSGTYGYIVEKSPLIDPHEVLDFSTPMSWAKIIAKSAPKIVGTETVDGKAALVVEFAPPHLSQIPGQISWKAWIWKEHPFLARIDLTVAERTAISEVKNIEFADIPDSIFERESSFFGVEPFLK